ncbi:hypothetical protein ACFVAV_15365 [Nocardia sp. NPDC057663]|uniref:hypothetical protein n=1 Tax=Nocardia sp. NPDC057663 TaxID=3346201 RepID=UPI00366C30F6
MKIKTAIAVSAITLGSIAAGAGLATAAPLAHTGWVGNYATFEACAADGNSPITGGSQWECVEVIGGWDLYTY